VNFYGAEIREFIKNADAVRIELMVALSEAYHNSILISTSFYPRPPAEIGWYSEIGLFWVILTKIGWVSYK